jgi:WD40 repeat protein
MSIEGSTVFTASGSGGVCCFTVSVAEGGDVALAQRWRSDAPNGGLATLGVSYSADADRVCAAGEDGVLEILHPENGARAWHVQSGEPALFGACWRDAHTAVSAGTVLALWDIRARASTPQRTLTPRPGAEAHKSSQLLCVSADPQHPHRLAAGTSDGSVHVWDVRGGGGGAAATPPLCTIRAAHTGDVWCVQLGSGPHGQLLSASSDGRVIGWELELAHGAQMMEAGEYERADQTLIELALPINSLHLSHDHDMLATASDAQVLTFVDLRG